MNTNTYLTQYEAAKMLRIPQRTLARYRRLGTGPKFIKIDLRVLYSTADIDAWLKANTFTTLHEAMKRGDK
jgi:DNA-binding transcriptional MerR regulator